MAWTPRRKTDPAGWHRDVQKYAKRASALGLQGAVCSATLDSIREIRNLEELEYAAVANERALDDLPDWEHAKFSTFHYLQHLKCLEYVHAALAMGFAAGKLAATTEPDADEIAVWQNSK